MKKSKKIGYVLPINGFGGTEIHSISLANYLSEMGSDITFIYPVNTNTSKVTKACKEGNFKIIDADIGMQSNQSLMDFYPIQEKNLFDSIKNSNFDLVIIAAPSPNTAFGILGAIKKLLIPSVCIFHLASPNNVFSLKEKNIFNTLITGNIKLVTVSYYTQDVLCQILDLSQNQIEVIENGVNIDTNTQESFCCLKEQLGIGDSLLVFSPGRLHFQKAYDTLLEAIPLVLKEIGNVHFLWVGEGDQKDALLKRISELGLEGNISIPGFMDKPYRLIPHVDLVAIPTRFESLSVRLLEAMEFGAPIVTTDASYQDRLLTDGYDALIAKVNDPVSLANKIIIALKNQELRYDIGRNAKKTVSNYSIERMYKSYLTLLNGFEKSNVSVGSDFSYFDNLRLCVLETEIILSLNGKELSLRELLKYPFDEVSSVPAITFVEVYRFESKVYQGHVLLSNSNCLGTQFINLLSFLLNGNELEEQLKFYIVETVFYSLAGQDELNSDLVLTLIIQLFSKPYMKNSYLENIITDLSSELFSDNLNDKINQLKLVINNSYSYKNNNKKSAKKYHFEPLGVVSSTKYNINKDVIFNSRPKVLIFAAHFNWPPKNGSDRRVADIIDLYSTNGCDCNVVRIGNMSARSSADLDIINKRFSCQFHDIFLTEKSFNNIKKSYSRLRDGEISGFYKGFYNDELLIKFNNIFENYNPDILHINYVIYGWLVSVAANSNCRTILDTHDLMSKRVRISKLLVEKSGGYPKRSIDIPLNFLIESISKSIGFVFSEEELSAFNYFDNILMISKSEKSLLESQSNLENLLYLPYAPVPEIRRIFPANGNNPGFSGGNNLINMSAMHLIYDVSRKVASLFDDFKVDIVGDISNSLGNAVFLDKKGFVNNISDCYFDWSYSLCPMPLSTGQNIKVTESIVRGCPVVTFPPIAKECGIIHGVNGLVAKDPQELFEIVRKLHMDTDFYLELVQSTINWTSTEYPKIRALNNFNFSNIIR